MQTEEANGNSLRPTLFSPSYTDSVNRQGENHIMAGFPVPSGIGEAMNISVHGPMGSHATVANSDEFWNGQLEKNVIRDFSIGNTCDSDQFMNGSPMNALSVAKYWATENQVKLTSSETFAYPCEYAKTAIVNNSSAAGNSSFESMNQGFNEELAFDTNTQWGINSLMNPPELLRRITARTGDYDPNEWIMHSNSPGSSRFSNELSLSLSTSQRSAVNGTSIQEQCSELSSSGYSLHKRQSEHASCSSSNLSLSFNSHKPVQFPPLLSGSRFFHAMQEILAEIACYAMEYFNQTSYTATGISNGVNLSYSPSDFSVGLDRDKRIMLQNNVMQEREVEAKKKHLLELLQMVDDQYSQCLDEIHTVVSAFHAVTELDPNLHARFALPAISFMYKNLRERISSYILAMGTATPHDAEERDENSFENSFIQKQWALQQLKKRDHQLWRPQRGLPERSVSVLRAWMFQNFLHPYPKDAEKHLLALKSGLTRSQVSNWFINARVRLWKPMIEEMYAEMNRRKVRGKDDENDGISTQRNPMRFENRRFTMD